jgi:hypothetical protein
MNTLSKSAELNITLLQKNYGKYKPVKGFHRFGKEKVADTGFNPKAAYTEFIQKDVTKPLEKPKQIRPIEPIPMEKWAVGTTKKSAEIEKIPKLQEFKNYNFPDKSKINPETYRSYFLPTDHINIKVPKIEVKGDKESYLVLKSKFGQHTETKDPWIPMGNFKTINNRSGVEYNIINHNDNNYSGSLVVTVSDKKVMNKKKGVGEIADLTKPFYTNFNKEYSNIYNSNPQIFHNYKGIFSHMYDAARRNGNIIMPFSNDNKVVKPKEN